MATKSVAVRRWIAHLALLGALMAAVPAMFAQAPVKFLGSVTAIDGNHFTVKTTAGDVHQFDIPSSASIRRIEPGQTSLSNAVAIPLSDLAVGDRMLVLLGTSSNGGAPQASEVIAIKHEDVVKRQQQQTQAWSEGEGGLVKSVDPSSGDIALASGTGLATKSVTVHTSPSTVLKRYAPASVSYAQAKPAPISDIHPGDELMARGTKNADGSELTAEEVVSGSFRNISGLITSIDAAGQTITVKDLITKKPVTIHITPEAQMRQLPERMAQSIAMRLKGQAAGGTAEGRGAHSENGGGGQNGGAASGGEGTGRGGPGMAQGARGGMSPQQILSRSPEIKLTDLQKSEAVMLVATQGTSEVTAITLIAGVEPLLEAPASQDLLSSWSMSNGSGSAEGGGEEGSQ